MCNSTWVNLMYLFQIPTFGDGVFADIQTTKGNMVVKLTYKETPNTVANFVSLAEGTNTLVADSLKGKPYYDGVIFSPRYTRFYDSRRRPNRNWYGKSWV